MKWGIRAEFIFILVFVICLLIASIGLNKIGVLGNPNDLGNNNGKSYYKLEQTLSQAGYKYYNEKYKSQTDTMIIKSSVLTSNGYMSTLYDEKGRSCSGYVKIVNGSTSVGYIKCPGYKTSGYDSSNE